MISDFHKLLNPLDASDAEIRKLPEMTVEMFHLYKVNCSDYLATPCYIWPWKWPQILKKEQVRYYIHFIYLFPYNYWLHYLLPYLISSVTCSYVSLLEFLDLLYVLYTPSNKVLNSTTQSVKQIVQFVKLPSSEGFIS